MAPSVISTASLAARYETVNFVIGCRVVFPERASGLVTRAVAVVGGRRPGVVARVGERARLGKSLTLGQRGVRTDADAGVYTVDSEL